MEKTHPLLILSEAERQLGLVEDIVEILDFRNKCEAIERLLGIAHASYDLQQRAVLLRLKAERKAGGWLSENMRMGPKLGPTLSDLEITKNESSRWQLIAGIPDEKFNAWIDERLMKGWDLTTGGLVAYARNSTNGYHSPSRHGVIAQIPPRGICALRGYMVECVGELTTEHIVRRSAYQGGSDELKAYYEDPMNKSRTCVNHNVGKLADSPMGRKHLIIQKIVVNYGDDVRDYFNNAPWKVFPPEWSFEGMLNVKP